MFAFIADEIQSTKIKGCGVSEIKKKKPQSARPLQRSAIKQDASVGDE
jgi:hypothetical protein